MFISYCLYVAILLVLHEQALKSGQLPADLKILDDDTETSSVNVNDVKMDVNSENEANAPKDVEEQKKDEAEPMDQVPKCFL